MINEIINQTRKLFYALLIVNFFILFSCTNKSDDKSAETGEITYHEIAPIIYRHCTPCHRPGSGAPFDLLSYNDINSHLRTIQLAVNERLMPPWPADTSYSHFLGEKVLTAEEINKLNSWIENGAPEGDLPGPVPPEYPSGSIFGKPDLVLSMREPFLIKGNNKDNFIMLKIPYELPADTFIRAIEIVPGNKKLVHHINAHLVQYDFTARKNIYSGEPFVDTEKADKLAAFEKLDLKNDNGSYPLLTPSVTNYLPGVEPAIYPRGIGGYHVKKKGALLLDNIHYGPSPTDTSDLTRFNVFFADTAPERPATEFILGTSGITPVVPPLEIPPGEIKKFRTEYLVPQTISLLTVNPHMHLIGKSFVAFAITPQNDTIKIIRIPQWDFRWQYFYTFPRMLKIPAGSLLVAEGVYDNTSTNPLNPFSPPQTIAERNGSMRTTDEMFQLICTYIPYREGDEFISLQNEKLNR
jgi:hypothetical protein